MLLFSKLITLVAIAALSAATAIQKRGPTCSEVSFDVNISALNFNLAGLDPNNIMGTIGSLINLILGVTVTGNFHIAGRYCEPEVFNPNRHNTLQFLVHGATYTREFWYGKGYNGDQYSWAAYASKQGYPTLAIDRLGNVASDHPDPILVVQYPAQAEVLHKVLQAIRTGAGNGLPRTFNRIIYAGHSYGSVIGNAITEKYPTDIDSIILTGYSSTFHLNLISVATNAVLLPANLVEPARYGNLATGYLEASNRGGVDTILYQPGAFDANLENLDWNTRGTFSAGELASLTLGGYEKSFSYSGSVYVVTGQYDFIFCASNCGTDNNSGPLANTRENYPLAASLGLFESYIVPGAGHDWQFHYAAHDAFVNIHQWLERKGF